MKIFSKLGVSITVSNIWTNHLAGLYFDYIKDGVDTVVTYQLTHKGISYHGRRLFDSTRIGLQDVLRKTAENLTKQFKE